MSSDELGWLNQRAETEYRRAQEAQCRAAQRSHFELATLYSERAEALARRLRWSDVGEEPQF